MRMHGACPHVNKTSASALNQRHVQCQQCGLVVREDVATCNMHLHQTPDSLSPQSADVHVPMHKECHESLRGGSETCAESYYKTAASIQAKALGILLLELHGLVRPIFTQVLVHNLVSLPAPTRHSVSDQFRQDKGR